MIVSLDKLKQVLGLPLESVIHDTDLLDLIALATVWVETATRCRFDTPIAKTEYFNLYEHERIILAGHVDDSAAADNANPTIDPTTSVLVARRPIAERFQAWTDLIEGTDWERREDEILFLKALPNYFCEELRVMYLDGYAIAPRDIAQVVLELAVSSYNYQYSVASNSAGIKSESLGDFSYSIDLNAPGLAGGSLSVSSMATLKRYKRQVV